VVQFHVSTPALGFSASSMTGAVAQFDAQLAQVTAAVNAVVGSTWTGSAADAFLEEWTGFLTSAGVTREALMSIAMRLQSGQSTYDGNEAQLTAASRSSNVNIRVPGNGGNGNGGGPQASAVQATFVTENVQAMPADVTIDASVTRGDSA
jgi:WXG100 family type VII secretion target